MKKSFFVLIVILVLVLINSCKKDPMDIPVGTFSADIGGSKITFQVQARASRPTVQNGFGIKMFGYKKDPAVSATSMTLVIVQPAAISPGTYVENAADNPLIEMGHYSYLAFGVGFNYSNYHSTVSPATITITEINSNSVKGTFQGELEGPDINGTGTTAKVLVTNGVFHLSF